MEVSAMKQPLLFLSSSSFDLKVMQLNPNYLNNRFNKLTEVEK